MLSLRDIVPRKDPDRTFESVRDPYQHVGDEFDLLARFLPIPLFDGLSNARKCFDSVSRVKAGGIYLMPEPRSPRQPFVIRHEALGADELLVHGRLLSSSESGLQHPPNLPVQGIGALLDLTHGVS